MKFLHSPSSYSSTSEFPTTSCIPAALRRLLCFHSLPTLPFDYHIEEYGRNELDENYCGNKLNGSPGIVAKLMGLDSMPAGNSINQWSELRLQKKRAYVHEAPTFVELENEKFIILSFEGGGKDKELELKSSKTRKGLIEFKEKTRHMKNQEMRICQTPENDAEVKNSCELFDSKSGFDKNSKKLCETECAKTGGLRNKIHQKVETESDSENSSPVSVLEFPDHQEASHSGKQASKSKNSRRKLTTDLEGVETRSSCNSTDEGVETSINGKRFLGLKKKNFMIGDMWEEICRMAEREVMDLSRVKKERWKGEEFVEIGMSFELQILDQLILELFTIT
ncbi:hypothetical protein L1887_12368 [Cichorium endivia]|nr:hypothetical protein L1887_12368 [Cichorium endivia]